MVFKIKEFESLGAIEAALDKDISEAKTSLGEYLLQLDKIRSSAEKARRVRQVVTKLAGKKSVSEVSDEVSVDGFNVVLNAGPIDELSALEKAVQSSQELLLALQNARKALQPLAELGDAEGLRYLVVENKGIPESILLRIS